MWVLGVCTRLSELYLIQSKSNVLYGSLIESDNIVLLTIFHHVFWSKSQQL